MKRFFKYNGLSITFFLLFLITIVGQIVSGFSVYNEQLASEGAQQVTLNQYFGSGHFIQATFENWESEFFQMAILVLFTVFLYQKGSSESNDPDEEEEETNASGEVKKDAPWPVKKGGWYLKLYQNSLSIALMLLFVLSFIAHFYGSMKDYNNEQLIKRQPTETAWQFLGNSRLWFESFQNWQSEFLSIFVIVLLSVYLRQKGSSQSKAVDAPHSQTGD